MKNIAINTALVFVGLLIGNFVGGCIADEAKERRQLQLRLEKLEQKK